MTLNAYGSTVTLAGCTVCNGAFGGKARSGAALNCSCYWPAALVLYCTVLSGGNNPLSPDALSYYSQICTGAAVPEAEAHSDSDTVFGRFVKFLLAASPVSIIKKLSKK